VLIQAGAGAVPVLLATFPMNAAAVSTAGGFAYVADGKTGIRVIDLADPARPALFAFHPLPGAVGVSVGNNYAFVADGEGLTLLRVQIQGKSFRVASCATGGKAFDVTVQGDWAYVASHSQGLRVVNMADPTRVSDRSLAGSLTTRFAQKVTVSERLAFVADGAAGVRIVDVSPAWSGAPAAPPRELGAYRTGGSANSVAVSGNIAYVAAGSEGLQVLDVSAPAAPTQIGSLRSTDASDIVLKETLAFLADGNGGVKVIDISTPAKPAALAAALPGNARSLALSGDTLVVAGIDGVRFVDVSDPRTPIVSGRYETRDAEGIEAAGRYVYVAEGYRGLTVLDISIPSRPKVVSACDDVFAVGVALKGDYAIVADSSGLKIVRILVPDWLSH